MRECSKLHDIDVIAAEHGWERDYALEHDLAGSVDMKGVDMAEAGVYERPLPNGHQATCAITYTRLEGTNHWSVLYGERNRVWSAMAYDPEGEHVEQRHWHSVTSLHHMLTVDADDFTATALRGPSHAADAV